MTRTVLVTGGAGYVGSHTVLHFRSLGWRVIVLDDFSTGHRAFAAHASRLVEGSLLDASLVHDVIASEAIDGVVHCAAKSLVGESVEKPAWYFRENIVGGVNLVDALTRTRPTAIVFSSSAAVYGNPMETPILETAGCDPVNPYGFTKLAIERLFAAAGVAHGLPWVSLRYFNAAGADAALRVGEDHAPETHLIPNIWRTVTRDAPRLRVFGDDYPTRDGTCVRDYIHVDDVARAHALALEHLWGDGVSDVFNLGTGTGFTVKEVLAAAAETCGKQIAFDIAERRAGDPPALVADPTKAARVLGWNATSSNLNNILSTAWAWHRHLEEGP